jgi:hypothetical protein
MAQEIQPAPVKPRKSRKKLVIAVILVIVVVIIIAAAASTSSSSSKNSSNLVKMSGPAPNYDEQEIVAFDENFTSLSYNITAVAQTTASGYGPAYLLNGVSNLGYWYQVGISYRWHSEINGISYRDPGFSGIYEAFAPNGTSIFPAGGGGGTLNVKVNPGDPVNLYLAFLSNGTVEFQASDSRTGSMGTEYFSSFGATYFAAIAGPNPNSDFFTGVMTEEYHVHPYYGNESAVTYVAYGPAVQGVVIAIDEYNASSSGKTMLFFNSSSLVDLSAYPSGYTYTYQGATVIATPQAFTTG